MKYCKTCVAKCTGAGGKGHAPNCTTYIEEEKKKMTNADRIRSMTDEELAEWLTTITTDAQKEVVESQCFVDYQWKEWLESEVEE